MLSHPGHLQTPWPYREWDPTGSSCNELRDGERVGEREREEEQGKIRREQWRW